MRRSAQKWNRQGCVSNGTVRTLLFDRAAASAYTLSSHRSTQGIWEEIMAKRQKRAKGQPKKRVKLRRKTGRAQKAAKSARRGGTKLAIGRAKPKPATKKAARKKQQRIKPPSREVETVVVDVIEQPAPGVITITEFEEQVPSRGWMGTKGDREA